MPTPWANPRVISSNWARDDTFCQAPFGRPWRTQMSHVEPQCHLVLLLPTKRWVGAAVCFMSRQQGPRSLHVLPTSTHLRLMNSRESPGSFIVPPTANNETKTTRQTCMFCKALPCWVSTRGFFSTPPLVSSPESSFSSQMPPALLCKVIQFCQAAIPKRAYPNPKQLR